MGGPIPPGSAAITLGRLVIVRRASVDDERLMRHELVHVRQWRELGVIRFIREYLGAYFRGRWNGYGHQEAYRRIPLEVEAEHEATATEATGQASAPPPE
ncbi:MAG TPA: DUF4157 domain-containing protein [Acidimicrobiales bacterium]|nr:DUF4157 domain-containing protein [Acidimicrobiales bacterium]